MYLYSGIICCTAKVTTLEINYTSTKLEKNGEKKSESQYLTITPSWIHIWWDVCNSTEKYAKTIQGKKEALDLLLKRTMRTIKLKSSHGGTVETNPTRNHEVVGSTPSLSGVRIRGCCELWCRLQMRLRSGMAAAVV